MEDITWETMRRRNDAINMNFGGIGYEGVDYMQIAQNIFHLSDFVNTALKLLLLQRCFFWNVNFPT
jgi:hypothetical protein